MNTHHYGIKPPNEDVTRPTNYFCRRPPVADYRLEKTDVKLGKQVLRSGTTVLRKEIIDNTELS